MDISKTNLNMMEGIQSKHVKTILGLGYKTHSTKLLGALRIEKVSKLSQNSALYLIRLSLCGSSVAKQFYGYLFCNDKQYTCKTLAERTVKCCAENNLNITKYMLNNTHANNVKYRLKSHLWEVTEF